MGGGATLLAAAVVTGLAIIAWVLGHMVPFFLILNAAGLFRVAKEEEEKGCDLGHGMGTDNDEQLGVSAQEAEVVNSRCGANRSSTFPCQCCTMHRCAVLCCGAIPSSQGCSRASAYSLPHHKSTEKASCTRLEKHALKQALTQYRTFTDSTDDQAPVHTVQATAEGACVAGSLHSRGPLRPLDTKVSQTL